MSQSSTAAALVHPHPADVIGEVLDRRYALLELTMGPGAGFYYAAYDLQELTRKRLRLLPDDSGCPSLDWYMVDELPEQSAQSPQSTQSTKAPEASETLPVSQPSQPVAVTPARPKPLTGPQRPLVSAQPPPLPPTLRAVPTAPATPAAPKNDSPRITTSPRRANSLVAEPSSATNSAPSAAPACTDDDAQPYGDERHSTAVRLEAAWFAQGEHEELVAEPLSFDDVYAGIARQAALDDLARVMSPEELREHGLLD